VSRAAVAGLERGGRSRHHPIGGYAADRFTAPLSLHVLPRAAEPRLDGGRRRPAASLARYAVALPPAFVSVWSLPPSSMARMDRAVGSRRPAPGRRAALALGPAVCLSGLSTAGGAR